MEHNDLEEDTLRDKAEAHKNAGNEAYSKKDFAKAISFYTEGIKIQCVDKELVSKLYNNRSTVYFYLENYHDCLSDVKAATALQPFYLKAIFRGASACLKLKQIKEAIIWCNKGLAIDKDNQELLEIKSCSIKEHENLSKQGGDEEAKEEDDSGNNPKSLDCTLTAENHKNAGNNAFRKDDFVTAINLYTEGIEVKCKDENLNAKLYNNRASAHYHLGNYPDCLSDVKAATALQPSYLKAIIRGANTCLKLKQFQEAIIWCDKGLTIYKDNQELLEIKTCSVKEREKVSKKGGDKEATDEGDSGTNPESLDCTSIAETHKNAGNDAFLKDDFVKAINLYTDGIEFRCKDEDLNAKLYNNRASAHYHLENYHDCLSDVKAATALQPSYLKAIIRGAKTCLKLKKFEEAIIWCDKGLAIDKDNKDLLEIKTCSVIEGEEILTKEGDKAAKEEGDSRTNQTSLDCRTIAETHKNAGNDAFSKHDFVEAINLYTEGIEVKCKDEDLNAKLYNNRASAHYHLGANTCLKLKQIEGAIIWCDKGLAVSFLYPVQRPSFFSIEIFMCAYENKNCGEFSKP